MIMKKKCGWKKIHLNLYVFDYEDSTDDDAPELPDNNEESGSNDTFGHKLLNWVLIFVTCLQAKHYLSDAAILSILKFISAVLILIDRHNNSYLAKNFPSLKYSLLKYFKLKDNFEQYVVCYKCHSVYKKVVALKKVVHK